MTQEEMRRAAGLEPSWEVLWTGAARPDAVQHLCEGLFNLRGCYEDSWVHLPYQAAATPGLEVAKCQRCRAAWVRAATPRRARRRECA